MHTSDFLFLLSIPKQDQESSPCSCSGLSLPGSSHVLVGCSHTVTGLRTLFLFLLFLDLLWNSLVPFTPISTTSVYKLPLLGESRGHSNFSLDRIKAIFGLSRDKPGLKSRGWVNGFPQEISRRSFHTVPWEQLNLRGSFRGNSSFTIDRGFYTVLQTFENLHCRPYIKEF